MKVSLERWKESSQQEPLGTDLWRRLCHNVRNLWHKLLANRVAARWIRGVELQAALGAHLQVFLAKGAFLRTISAELPQPDLLLFSLAEGLVHCSGYLKWHWSFHSHTSLLRNSVPLPRLSVPSLLPLFQLRIAQLRCLWQRRLRIGYRMGMDHMNHHARFPAISGHRIRATSGKMLRKGIPLNSRREQ